MSIAKIRVLERELSDAITAAKAGGAWSADHRRRAGRLRGAIMQLKFSAVRPRRQSTMTAAEMRDASLVDATVQHIPNKVKKIKQKPVVNFRARDFDASRRVAQRENKVTIRQRGMFKLGEIM